MTDEELHINRVSIARVADFTTTFKASDMYRVPAVECTCSTVVYMKGWEWIVDAGTVFRGPLTIISPH
jgi:hypothetical protein